MGPSVAAPAAGEAVIRAHALERTGTGGPETHSWPATFPGDWHAHATRIPYLEPQSPWPQPVRNEKSEICYGHRCRRVGVMGAPGIGRSRRNHPRTGVCFLFQGDGRSNWGLRGRPAQPSGEPAGVRREEAPRALQQLMRRPPAPRPHRPQECAPRKPRSFWKTEGLGPSPPNHPAPQPSFPPASPCPQTLCIWQHPSWVLVLSSSPCECYLHTHPFTPAPT